jgi:hypothetical protein
VSTVNTIQQAAARAGKRTLRTIGGRSHGQQSSAYAKEQNYVRGRSGRNFAFPLGMAAGRCSRTSSGCWPPTLPKA